MDLVIAVIIDILIGDPHSFPHPVKLMGKLISFEEKKDFDKNRYLIDCLKEYEKCML